MVNALHQLIVPSYLAAPFIALLLDGWMAWKKGRGVPSANLVTTIISGILIGTGLSLIYAVGIGGHLPLTQILLSIYFAIGLLVLLRCFDWLVRTGVARVMPRKRFAAAVTMARIVVLIGVGLPYVMAAIMTYRVKVVPRDDPSSLMGFPFQRIGFESTDGVKLSGWWIPATERTRSRREAARDPDFARRTVIVCHGLAANKANQLVLARQLVPAGYNVLAFDFRAHGQSGGQLTSFGDLERRDVLGAVRWLLANKPQESQRIVGVGASMGAAALVAAAADPSDEGQSIEAIALYGTFDDLGKLSRDIGRERFIPPMNWFVPQLAVPFASVQVGADLGRFRPAEMVTRVWPRPIMVIHGMRDSIIPFDRGERLFRESMQPKAHLWLPDADHNQVVEDEDAARAVLDFFQTARAVQVI